MPISMLNNVAALTAKRHLDENIEGLGRTLERLSSGSRINRAGDDAAGLTIANAHEARIRSLQQAERNTFDAISVAQVAEGGMNEVSNLILRLRELAIQSASDTIGDEERQLLEIEATQIREELDRLAESTKYLGTSLLNGQGREFVFQIGPDNNENNRLVYASSKIDVRPSTLGVDDVHVNERDDAQDALETLDKAIAKLGAPRAHLGAIQERMHSITRQLASQAEGLITARGRILDADLAAEATDALRQQVRVKAGTAVLAQANMLPNIALRLLEG